MNARTPNPVRRLAGIKLNKESKSLMTKARALLMKLPTVVMICSNMFCQSMATSSNQCRTIYLILTVSIPQVQWNISLIRGLKREEKREVIDIRSGRTGFQEIVQSEEKGI
jgi:hypothetical protein